MHTEKLSAFHECWAAMWLQAVRVQSSLIGSMFAVPPTTVAAAATRLNRSTSRNLAAATHVLNAGLKPLHAKAVSNSKRLARKRK